MFKTVMSRSAIVALTCSLSISAYAIADGAKRALHIPSGELTTALELLARQSGSDLVYRPDQVQGFRTNGVDGELSTEEAVTRLLQGTPLRLSMDATGAMLIALPTGADSSPSAPPPAHTEPAPAPPKVIAPPAKDTERKPETRDTRIKQSEVEEFDPVITAVPEILVKGSKSLNMDIQRSRDDAQPYVVFDRETLANSGATNLEDFMRQRLTMETTALSESQGNSFLGTRSSINLRGLGANQTLILIDGHRMAGVMAVGGVYQPDINGLPLSAIERIEVLPTSASGIYGGSATGGVVNIVLRRNYGGVESKLTYDNAFDGDALRRRVDLSAGTTLENGKTSVLLAGSFSDGHRLLAQDRNLLARNRQRILENNPAYIYGTSTPPVGRTTNIRSVSGANLVLDDGTPLNSPYTHVPEGYAGPASDAGHALIAQAGQYNFAFADSTASGLQPLLNTPEVESLMLTVRRELTPRLTAFIEASGSNNVSESPSVAMSGAFTLRANNPNNPFDSDIRVQTPLLGLAQESVVDSHDRRVVAGLIGRLSHDWMAEIDYSFDRSRYASRSFGSSGVASFDVTAGALNVMRDTNVFATDFSQYVDEETIQLPSHSEMKDATFRMSGPVLTLPGGAVTLSMLLERREEIFGPSLRSVAGDPPSGNPDEQSQRVNSAYLEAVVPVVSTANSLPGVRELQLQLAGRYDDYKTSGTNYIAFAGFGTLEHAQNTFNSTNTTLGLRYVPFQGVLLRGSRSTGFLPPAVNQLVPASFEFEGFYTDPLRGDEELGLFTSYFGGNAGLKPELSTTWSAGLVLTPLDGLRFSVDWFHLEKRDNIVSPDPAVLLASEARFPGRIVRAAPEPGDPYGVGKITAIDGSDINIAHASTSGFDLAFDYTMPVGRFGTLQWFALGTITQHYRTQTFPDFPVEEHLGLVTSQSLAVTGSSYPIKRKGNAGAVWNYQQWTAGWSARFFDSYTIDAAQVFGGGAGIALAQGHDGRVASQTYHDLFVTYRIPHSNFAGGLLTNTEWQLGIRNLFNTRPPLDVSNASGGYYSGFGDPRLASYYVSLKKAF
jgi:outer membrane receptor protein involved in Fe transport